MSNFLYVHVNAKSEEPTPWAIAPVSPRANSRAAKVNAEYAAAALAVERAPADAADRDALIATRDALAVKAKGSVKVIPGDGCIIRRWNVSDEQLAAYLAEPDPAKRAAMFAVGDAVETGSPVHPSVANTQGMLSAVAERAAAAERTAREQFLAELASGLFIVPTAARGASAKSDKRLTAEQKRDAALSALFGDEPVADAPDDAPTDEVPADKPRKARG